MLHKNFFIVKKKSLAFALLVIVFAFITAMRGNTPDTINYKILYDSIESISLDPRTFYSETYMEYGYGLINYVSSLLNFNFRFFLFLYSLFTFFIIKKAADIFGVNSVLVLFCYIPTFYFLHQWAQIRQGTAIALAYYFLSLTLVNKNLKSTVVFLTAISLHNVSFPFILFFKKYIYNLIKYFKKYFYTTAIVTFILTIIVIRLFSTFGLAYSDRLINYSSLEEVRSVFHPVNLRAYLMLLFFFALRPKNNENQVLDFLIIIYTVGVAIRLGFYDFLILSGRLGTVFTFSEIFILPLLLSIRFSKTTVYLSIFIYFILSLYLSLNFQTPDIINLYIQNLPER